MAINGHHIAVTQPVNGPNSRPRRSFWPAIANVAGRLSEVLFAVVVILMLTTPSWRAGPFTWLPLIRLDNLGGVPAAVGLLALLPLAFGASWFLYEVATWRSKAALAWIWGRPGITAPLLLLTVFGLTTLDLAAERIAFIQIGGLIIFWAIYLYLLNARPNAVLPLGVIVFVQGVIAVVQFVKQGDLGLVQFGELPLDPSISGVSVIFAREQRWLRGYGLTAHPNQLGAMIAAILLLLLPALKRSSGRTRILLAVCYGAGLAGILVTFSRTATLAFVAGLVASFILDRRPKLRNMSRSDLKRTVLSPVFLLAVAVAVVIILVLGDLALSRVVGIGSGVEAISVNQRLSDWKLAIQIIGEHPFQGAGLGQYLATARALDDFAVVVHSVPLLVTAELGIIGLLIVLWLMVSGLRSRPAARAPWIAVIIIGAFDITLWLTGSWQSSLLLAFGVANLSYDITTH